MVRKIIFKRRRCSSFQGTFPMHRLYVLVVLGLLFPRPSHVLASSSVSSCNLECPTEIGAKCAFGDAPDSALPGFSHETLKNINGMHCTCPDFYTGILCEHTFDSCGDQNQHVCYHGGECRAGAVDEFGNVQHYCDCTNAKDPSTQRPFVGKYCELATVATCDDKEKADLFCFNGGICNEKYPEFGAPCLCNGQHSGPQCEFTHGDNVTTVNNVGDVVNPTDHGNCTLTCNNGGTCLRGTRSFVDQSDEYLYWIDEENLDDDMYCHCTDAWDGPTCSIPKVACGHAHCFNGATCVPVMNSSNALTYNCDCTAADNNNASYAGRYCQYKATEYCTKDPGLNGILFCVNKGLCKENAYEGCDCPDGYSGFSCEFKNPKTNDGVDVIDESEMYGGHPVIDTPSNCTLECRHGGTCRHGPKRLGGNLDLFAGNTSYLNEEAGTSSDWQHCVCPSNFAGAYCEHQLDTCGDGKHLCLHGSTCVDLGQEQLCDCDEAESPLATFFAGTHCEHPVNDICTENSGSSTPSTISFGNGMPGTALAFCVNGGTCKEKVPLNEPHPGCHCLSGYLGPHCELREAPEVSNIRNYDPYANPQNFYDSGPSGLAISMVVLGVCAVFVAAFFAVHWYIRRRHRRNAATTTSLTWAVPKFRDDGSTEINFAPKRGSMQSSDDDTRYEDAIFKDSGYVDEPPLDSTAASYRTEFSARDLMMETTPPGGQHLFTSGVEYYDDEDDYGDNDSHFPNDMGLGPQIDIGPPIDEDGHELHNVEIV